MAKRERLVAELREYVANLDTAAAAEYAATHEAVAWAVDAERFLGSFHRGASGFRAEHVDAVGDHLLVWLAERGCTVVRDVLAPVLPDKTPTAELVLSLDPASGMVLDGRTARFYEAIHADGDLGFEELPPEMEDDWPIELNTIAAAWCDTLQLSARHADDPAPPSGRPGQYGRYGCVLRETVASLTTVVHDVCLFPYDDADMDRFVTELLESARVAVVDAPVTVRDIAETINGLHPLSRYAHRSMLDHDLSQVMRRTDIETALAWGRRHADRLVDEW